MSSFVTLETDSAWNQIQALSNEHKKKNPFGGITGHNMMVVHRTLFPLTFLIYL